MSNVGATSGILAVVALAAKKKQESEEEEKLTTYNSNDLENWEFKIVRSDSGAFKRPEFVQKICAEESAAGWIMLEKFDNCRIRFKREISHRRQDQSRLSGMTGADGTTKIVDPYRTSVGFSGGATVGIIIGIMLLVVGTLTALQYSTQPDGSIDIGMPIVVLTIGLVALVAIIRKKRGR